MRIDSYQHKIRVITKETKRMTYGVTIPTSFSHWFGLLVCITESGNSLILESGCIPHELSKGEIKNFGEVVEKIKV